MPFSVLIRSSSAEGDPPALTFDGGGRVVIGRGMGCDVRLPDPSVSVRHASIRLTDRDPMLIDEGSTNGTYVGGVKLSPHSPRVVRSGDLIRVGRVWLELRVDQTPPTRDLKGATRDIALALVGEVMSQLGQDVVTKVRVVEGHDLGAALPLVDEGRVYLIGRGEHCDLSLEDADASREHAQVVRRGGAVLLRDLGARNGVTLGDARVAPDRDVVWRTAAMVRIGQTVLALDEPIATALADLEQAEDERVPADEPPPTPPPSVAEPGAANVAGGNAAPIAHLTPAASAPNPLRRHGSRGAWSGTDVAVVIAAVSVIALSVAGLFWLLRG